jgi:hypothetical protein
MNTCLYNSIARAPIDVLFLSRVNEIQPEELEFQPEELEFQPEELEFQPEELEFQPEELQFHLNNQ